MIYSVHNRLCIHPLDDWGDIFEKCWVESMSSFELSSPFWIEQFFVPFFILLFFFRTKLNWLRKYVLKCQSSKVCEVRGNFGARSWRNKVHPYHYLSMLVPLLENFHSSLCKWAGRLFFSFRIQLRGSWYAPLSWQQLRDKTILSLIWRNRRSLSLTFHDDRISKCAARKYRTESTYRVPLQLL